MTLVAPARRVLSVVHRVDPDRPATTITVTPDLEGRRLADLPKGTATGWTVCGLPLLVDEVWIPVNPQTAPLCGRCAGALVEPSLFDGGEADT